MSPAEEMLKIQAEHPSICYDCELSRRPASDENIRKGYVGCCLLILSERNKWTEVTDATEVGTGWVDLRSRCCVGIGSGIITNEQLVTLEVKSCNKFQKII